MLGGGSYGSAIAHRLAGDNIDVLLWDRNGETVHSINTQHTNPKYLRNFVLSETLRATQSLEMGMLDRGIIVIGLPSQALPSVLPHLRPHPESLVISLTKGFIIDGWDPQKDPRQLLSGPPEGSRVLTPIEYLKTLEGWRDVKNVVAVAGPAFAKNIINGCRFGLTAAAYSEEAARRASYLLTSDRLRVQTSLDPVGVEIAAAMKNVIAIAVGVVQGLKNQDGTPRYGVEEIEFVKAKGIEEMARLSKHLGGRYRTLHTFAGWADLNLTTASTDSRNNRLGRELANGGKLLDIISQLGQTAEGVYAAWGAKRLTDPQKVCDGWIPGIRMDLTNALIDILQGVQTPSRIIDVYFKQTENRSDDPFEDQPWPHMH
jgi:glycerol-3-phosphate dehydrogenase (NAD(P)+)